MGIGDSENGNKARDYIRLRWDLGAGCDFDWSRS